MISTQRLSLEDARSILAACELKAREIGVDMDIAVTDDSGNLIAFQRMDGARITSINISIDKAWTAAAARKSTRDYWSAAQPGSLAYGINASNGGRFSTVPGGLPVLVDGQIVGGVGCSSGTPDQDEVVSQAGIDAFLDTRGRDQTG
ncbi:MAG: heme-binding protein [Chromatiaceae bacterium]|nr:heme-binding protein [Chromatiaceae bacterium]